MEPKPPSVEVVFVDDPHATEFFGSWVSGINFDTGNTVRITFATHRPTTDCAPGTINRVVTGRIVMPVQTAQALAACLYDFLKNQGLDPVPVPQGSSVQ